MILQRDTETWLTVFYVHVTLHPNKFLYNKNQLFLIPSFRRVLYVVCFLLGNYPASEIYMPTFRNTLSVPSS